MIYSLDLGIEHKKLIEHCLQALNMLFGDEKQGVDITTFNPSRICKLYGTEARKGAHTEQRPHRMSRLLQVPEILADVSVEQLQALADTLPQAEPANTATGNRKGSFDLQSWIVQHSVEVKEQTTWSGGSRWILDHCPFNPQHDGKDAALIQTNNGSICFHCFHSSCADKRWRDFRLLYEPDAYQQKGPAIPDYMQSKPPDFGKTTPPDAPPAADISRLFVNLSRVEASPKRYIFKPYMPVGKYSIWSADPGVGKTKALLSMAAKITVGADLCGIPCDKPGPVVIFSREDDNSDIMETLAACGANLEAVHALAEDEETLKALAADPVTFASPLVEEAIKAFKPVLVIFDPYQKYLGATVDMNKANQTSAALAPVVRLAKHYDCHIAIIAHNTKADVGLNYKFMGSQDFIGEARSAMSIVRDPENPEECIAIHVKTNNARGMSLRYRIESIPDNPDYATVQWRGLCHYTEKEYAIALRKMKREQEKAAAEAEVTDDDPVVATILQLLKENPGGLKLGHHDLDHAISVLQGASPGLGLAGIRKRYGDYLRKRGIALDDGPAQDLHPFTLDGEKAYPIKKKDRYMGIRYNNPGKNKL